MSPYEVLGIPQDAKGPQIKAAYRRQSAKVHPDKGGSAEAFRRVREAYDVLIDPERRKRYDTTGKTSPSRATKDHLAGIYRQIMKSVVAHVDWDDPTRCDVKRRMLEALRRDRAEVQNKLFNAQRRLERATRLVERFTPQEDFDPIGSSLRGEIREIEEEILQHEDAMEVSLELEKVLDTYEYNTDPQPEGQHDWGPGTVPVTQSGGPVLRSSSTFWS